MPDLVTFGETMLRLSPPSGERLARVDRFDVHVGGAESNVAVTAAALGVDAAWLSALPATDLGERVAHAIRGEGVDPLVAWTDHGRVGTYYLERGTHPRGQAVHYDRAGTPVREITPQALDTAAIGDAEVFLTTGITPALSERAATTVAQLLEIASDADTRTAFDVNYRSKLWSPEAARETLRDLFPAVDVLFVAERDARKVLDSDGGAETVARALADRHGFETVVVTRGERGALALRDGTAHEQPGFETDTVDPVGSGDAFVGGFLARRLEGGSVADALADGAAAAALKRTVEGDATYLSADEVATVTERETEGNIDR